MRVLDDRGFCAGYIYVPDLETTPAEEAARFKNPEGGEPVFREFMALSRASTTSDPRVGRELLHATPISELSSVYSMSYGAGWLQPGTNGGSAVDPNLDEAAHFDTRLYDATTPWGLFNVMMIERQPRGGILACRVAVGRIHVAPFMNAQPVQVDAWLQ